MRRFVNIPSPTGSVRVIQMQKFSILRLCRIRQNFKIPFQLGPLTKNIENDKTSQKTRHENLPPIGIPYLPLRHFQQDLTRVALQHRGLPSLCTHPQPHEWDTHVSVEEQQPFPGVNTCSTPWNARPEECLRVCRCFFCGLFWESRR